MFKQEDNYQKRFVIFQDIRRILRLNPMERSEDQIEDLAYYFRNNEFFKKYGEENGEAGLNMIYKVMKFQAITKDKYVMKFGEIGTKFYIILRGQVSVRIPSYVERHFSFRKLLKMLVENEQWIIENDKFEEICKVIQKLMPEVIKFGYRIKFDFKTARKIVEGEKMVDSMKRYPRLFPGFDYLPSDDPYSNNANIDSKLFRYDIMLEVAKLGTGIGFGELALLNEAPRSATITTLEDSQFAILNKADFNEIMAKVLRKRFANDVQFISSFPFLDHLTRKAKEKLCFFFKKETFSIGQNVITEGMQTDYVYFIKKGAFEIK